MATTTAYDVIVVGAGPAGLATAERAAANGCRVAILDGVRGPGRKFLVAGRSGLNLTHDATAADVLRAVGPSAPRLQAAVSAHPPEHIRDWAAALDTPTFVGTSGKVFPEEHHAAGLLHRWLARLDALGIERHHCQRLTALDQAPSNSEHARWRLTTHNTRDPKTADSVETWSCRSVVLACGGGSWPQTGSDGGWVSLLRDHGVGVTDLAPANCGVVLKSDPYLGKHAGSAIKDLATCCGAYTGIGEAVVTQHGLEGNALYPAIPGVRDALTASDQATPQSTSAGAGARPTSPLDSNKLDAKPVLPTG